MGYLPWTPNSALPVEKDKLILKSVIERTKAPQTVSSMLTTPTTIAS
jgi:hypothetical protein